MLDMVVKINCENNEEIKIIERELIRFKRRIKHIKNKGSNKFDYEASVVNLETGKIKTTINRRGPRENNL